MSTGSSPSTDRPVFGIDLDDTLYRERDWAAGALRAGAYLLDKHTNGRATELLEPLLSSAEWPAAPLQALATQLGVFDHDIIEAALSLIRTYSGPIEPFPDVVPTLRFLGRLGIVVVITDGRSCTQRRKLASLGVEPLLQYVLISGELEGTGTGKLDGTAYRTVRHLFGESNRFFMIGDQYEKDFLIAEQHGFEALLVRREGVQYVHPFPGGVSACGSLAEACEAIRKRLDMGRPFEDEHGKSIG